MNRRISAGRQTIGKKCRMTNNESKAGVRFNDLTAGRHSDILPPCTGWDVID
jgi:hypothetical protein